MMPTRRLEPESMGMTRLPPGLALVLLAVMTASGCEGCEPRATPEHTPPAAQPELETPKPEFLRLDHRLLELAGEPDFGNRYLGTVKVTAMEGEEERMRCSGTLLAPRVVLTAGHCVCRLRKEAEGRTVITGSACYDSAEVETLLYQPETVAGATLRPSQGTMHEGRVQPHPELKVVLDPKGRVSSSHADLALIFLNTPVKFAGFPVASGEARMGETVILVGHGYDEVEGVFGWERRFSLNQVSRLGTAEDERVLIRQPGGHRYRQDSGGPCLRQGAKEPELLGISSRWLGEGAAFTSLQPYQGWLREALRHAETAGGSGSDHPP